jgi:hypothetical protein
MTLPSALNLQGDLETAKALLDALGVTITVAAEDTNVVNVAIQVIGGDDQDVDANVHLLVWLTDTEGAAVVPGTAPSGGTAVGATGVVLVELTADVLFLAVTDANGNLELDVTEAGAATWYLNVGLPGGGVVVSDVLTFT